MVFMMGATLVALAWANGLDNAEPRSRELDSLSFQDDIH